MKNLVSGKERCRLTDGQGLERCQKIDRFDNRDEWGLVIRKVPRYQIICLTLQGTDHLNCIFEIRIIQIQGLINGILIDRGNSQELQ